MAQSKYERFIEASAEREKRKANIEELQKKIARDEDILAVMPRDRSNLGNIREYELMYKNVTRMKEWLNEEIALHNATLQENLDINI